MMEEDKRKYGCERGSLVSLLITENSTHFWIFEIRGW